MSTLLVLEGESYLMKLLVQMLKPHSILEASTSDKAIDLFNRHRLEIALMVADVTVPIRSGIHVALLLRSVKPGLPVILTSGYPVGAWHAQDSSDLKTLGSYSVAILQKPFQAHALLHAVRELTDRFTEEQARSA